MEDAKDYYKKHGPMKGCWIVPVSTECPSLARCGAVQRRSGHPDTSRSGTLATRPQVSPEQMNTANIRTFTEMFAWVRRA
jgi:hypothetical protein